MSRFVVYVTATERVGYKHVVEADSEAEARRIAADLPDDAGTWTNTSTEDSVIDFVEQL